MKRNKIALLSACLLLGALAGCGGRAETVSETEGTAAETEASSERTEAEGETDQKPEETHTVIDHGGNEVEVPNEITRVVIDQIPILSTYMAYFGGEAPYIVGYCGSFKQSIS